MSTIFEFNQYYKKWDHLNSHVRLLVCMTLAISLIISIMIFVALTIIQKQDILTDVAFIKDLIQISKPFIKLVISTDNLEELCKTIEKLYLNLSRLKYIVIFDMHGKILSCIPENIMQLDHFAHVNLHRLYFNVVGIVSDIDIHYSMFQEEIILELVITFFENDQSLIVIQTGFMLNANILLIVSLISKIIIGVFVSIWLTALLTLGFNLSIIRSSIMKISKGIKEIASGNFSARISPSVIGYTGDLVARFNQMAERLEFYEKKNVEQINLERLKLETLISIIADGAILLDQELRIVFINQSASETFEFLQSCMVGNYIFYYLPRYINDQLLPVLNQMIEYNSMDNISAKTCNLSIHLKNDVPKTFRFVITTVLDPDSQLLTGIGIIIQDVTKQIGLDEVKAQFISNVSHELRTPLFNIRSFLETLSEYRNSLTEKQKVEFLDIANQETQRLTYLVNDVLDLSRLESDFLDPLESIELYDIIPPVIQSYQLRAKKKHVKLIFQICPNIGLIHGYTSLLTQVLSNLIGNSLKFTWMDGRIIVKVYKVKFYSYKKNTDIHKLRIEVLDEGRGIRKFDYNRIFDRFVRLENNVHILEGTGLGLSIVKNIVNKHNSNIYLYSELGSGSSFWFDLDMLEKKN